MPAPVKQRTVQSYARDVETLQRLKCAVMTDPTLDEMRRKTICERTDSLSEALAEVLRGLREVPR